MAPEAMDERSPSTLRPSMGSVCPKCGRVIEAGFKFCDGCGASLSTAPQTPAVPPPTVTLPPSPAAIPVTHRKKRHAPFSLRRVRGRRESHRLDVSVLDSSASFDAPADVWDEPRHARGATSKLTSAGGLRGARAAIGGWLQRGSTRSSDVPATDLFTQPERTLTFPSLDDDGRPPRTVFVIQLGIAFLAGLVLVVAITAAASLLSDGSIAILEMGGLPIFIGGAASVVVFVLVRSNATHHAQLGGRRTAALATIVSGLAALVVAAGLLYQPAVARRIQPRIERVLGVFGNEDVRAVNGIREDLEAWNASSKEYQQMLEATLREGVDFEQLRRGASDAEGTLDGLILQMREHARLAQHADLRDALDDLVSIFDDQLGGLRVVNRGLILDTLELVRTGDARFKDAENRAKVLYEERLRSLLSRGGFDADAFGELITG